MTDRPPGFTNAHQRSGFTLIELLVTVSIIAVLAVLLMSGVSAAMESAKSAKCAGNLRQIGGAMSQFIADYNYGPPHNGAPFWDSGAELVRKTKWHWMTYLAPYLGAPDYEGTMSPAFACPSDPNVKSWPTYRPYLPESASSYSHKYSSYGYNYATLTTSRSWFYLTGGPRCPPLNTIKNPSSVVLLTDGKRELAEAGFAPPDAIVYSRPNNPSGRHHGRFNAYFLDGHVQSLEEAKGYKRDFFEFNDERK